jgi:hypothetical protein
MTNGERAARQVSSPVPWAASPLARMRWPRPSPVVAQVINSRQQGGGHHVRRVLSWLKKKQHKLLSTLFHLLLSNNHTLSCGRKAPPGHKVDGDVRILGVNEDDVHKGLARPLPWPVFSAQILFLSMPPSRCFRGLVGNLQILSSWKWCRGDADFVGLQTPLRCPTRHAHPSWVSCMICGPSSPRRWEPACTAPPSWEQTSPNCSWRRKAASQTSTSRPWPMVTGSCRRP